MKRGFLSLFATILLLGFSGNAFAEIVTYTFQGTVTSIRRDASIMEDLISIGDNVEFTFNCEFDSKGTMIRYDDQLIERDDYQNEAEDVDYFWCDYVGGTDIGPIGDISLPNPNFFKEWNYGLSNSRKENGTIVQHTGFMYGGSTYNWVAIENYSQHVQDWGFGNTGITFTHRVRNQKDQTAWIRGNLTLVYVSSTQPEPQEDIQDIIGAVGEMVDIKYLTKSEGKKLINPLSDALDLMIIGNINATIEKLNNFILKLERHIRFTKISELEGNALIHATKAVIDQLMDY